VEKDQRADRPREVKLKQSKEAATSSPSVKKRDKYGVQDDSISVKDSFRQFETSGRELRKAKTLASKDGEKLEKRSSLVGFQSKLRTRR